MIVADRTRRLICRAGLLTLCLLPTLAIVAWIVSVRLPWRRVWAERTIGERLGAEVTIGEVRFPRPGVTRYQRFALTELGTHQTLLRAEGLEIDRNGAGCLVVVHGAEVAAGRHGLWPLLRRCVEPAVGGASEPVELAADRVTLKAAGRRYELAQVTARLEGGTATPHLTIALQVVGHDHAERQETVPPVRLELSGDADGEVTVDLNTGEAELPATLAAAVVPCAARLGTDASFRGRLHVLRPEGAASGEVRGQWTQIELATLLAELLPRDLAISGPATLALDSAKFDDGRLVEAAGTLRAGPGNLGPRFLDAAADSLHLTARAAERPAPHATVRYGHVALRFALDAAGFKVQGLCADSPAGTLMTGAEGNAAGVLLSEGTASPLPPTALARLFSPETTDWVPATPQSQWLLGRLPLSPSGETPRR